MCINVAGMPCIAYDWKVVLKDFHHVCHSAGQHISDVIASHWYYNQWTSETACITHPRLPVSAVPQLKTVIAIQSLLHGSPHCKIYHVQVWTVSRHIIGSIKVTFRSAGIWWCLAVRWRAILLQKHFVGFISGVPSYWILLFNFCITLFDITCRLCMPKIVRFGQIIWKIQAKMWVGPIFWPRLYTSTQHNMLQAQKIQKQNNSSCSNINQQVLLTSSTELRSSEWMSLTESDALDGDFTKSSSSSSSSTASAPVTKFQIQSRRLRKKLCLKIENRSSYLSKSSSNSCKDKAISTISTKMREAKCVTFSYLQLINTNEYELLVYCWHSHQYMYINY